MYVRTELRAIYSPSEKITLGVPQGAVLSPTLFNIHVNNMSSFFESLGLSLSQYADDSNILVVGADEASLKTGLNNAANGLESWLQTSQLLLNGEKTFSINFHSSQSKPVQPKICIMGSDITYVPAIKVLGVWLDEKLTWLHQIETLCKRLSSICYLLRMLRNKVSHEVLRDVYTAKFESLMSYGLMFWGSSSHWSKVFKVQKKAIRILHGKERNSEGHLISCKKLFNQYKILTLPSLYIYEAIKFTLANQKSITYNSDIHNYDTRTKSNIALPTHNSTFYQKNVFYMGSKFFNAIHKKIKALKGTKSFRTELKTYLISRSFYTM